MHTAFRSDRRALWLILLASPLVWCLYFSVVYLLAEAGCAINIPWLKFEVAGLPGLSVVVIASTVIASFATLYYGGRAMRVWRANKPTVAQSAEPPAHERNQFMALAGFLLSALFLASTLLMGVPALVLQPCV